MAKVFYWDYSQDQNLWMGLREFFTLSNLKQHFSGSPRVAIKLHMGERGNVTYLRPSLLRRIVDLVKEAGGKPFLTDTTALYTGKRFTQKDYLETGAVNGFAPETMGCPVVIADGDGGDSFGVPLPKTLPGAAFSEIPLAKGFQAADFLLVVSHFKGHMMSGMGGALKNLAMGCVDKKGKALQHHPCKPILKAELCEGCGVCAENCAFGALSLVEGKPRVNDQLCMSCSICLFTCPEDAWSWKTGYQQELMFNMAHTALGVQAYFKDRCFYLNFLLDITYNCDCCAPAGRTMFPDLGMMAGFDPVSLDTAGLKLLDQSPTLPGIELPPPPDRLGRHYGLDSFYQLKIAEELGLGESNYQLLDLKKEKIKT